jgi:hypothetical protein
MKLLIVRIRERLIITGGPELESGCSAKKKKNEEDLFVSLHVSGLHLTKRCN